MGVGHRLTASGGVNSVIQDKVIEILGIFFGDCRQRAHVHQDVAFGVEQDDLLVGPGQGKTQGERSVASHGWVAQGHVPVGLVAEVDPMAAAPAWNHHGVAPVRCEGFEHICCLEHQSSTRSLILIWVSLDETVVFIADQDRHRLLGFFGLFEGHGDPVGIGVALHQVILDAKGV